MLCELVASTNLIRRLVAWDVKAAQSAIRTLELFTEMVVCVERISCNNTLQL